MMESALQRDPRMGKAVAASPLQRMAKAEEVADVIVFLCSPRASYVNGTGLMIDAGLMLGVRMG